MFGLVNADFAAAGKGQAGQFSPTLFTYLRDPHLLRLEIFQGRCDVIAHEVKLVLVMISRLMRLGIMLLANMKSNFERRHGENQPAMAGVYGRELKHVAKKTAV